MNGQLVWERHLGEEYSPFQLTWGHASSPTLYEDLLILLCDHVPAAYLLALDKRTGQEQWKVDRGRNIGSYSTPLVVPGPQGDALIVNSSLRLDAYDPSTGEWLWQAGEPNRFPIGVATYDAGMLYTSRGQRSGPYMAIRLGGRGDVSDTHVEWRVPTGAPYISSILILRRLDLHGQRQRDRQRHRCQNGRTRVARADRRDLHGVAGRRGRQGLPAQRDRGDRGASGRAYATDTLAQRSRRAQPGLTGDLEWTAVHPHGSAPGLYRELSAGTCGRDVESANYGGQHLRTSLPH